MFLKICVIGMVVFITPINCLAKDGANGGYGGVIGGRGGDSDVGNGGRGGDGGFMGGRGGDSRSGKGGYGGDGGIIGGKGGNSSDKSSPGNTRK